MIGYSRERLAGALCVAGFGERRAGRYHIRWTEVLGRAKRLAKPGERVPTVPGLKYIVEKGSRCHREQLAPLARVAGVPRSFIAGDMEDPRSELDRARHSGELASEAGFDPNAPPTSEWARHRFARRVYKRVSHYLDKRFGPAGKDGRRAGEDERAWMLAPIIARIARPDWWRKRLLEPPVANAGEVATGNDAWGSARSLRDHPFEKASVQVAEAFTVILQPWLEGKRDLREDVLFLLFGPAALEVMRPGRAPRRPSSRRPPKRRKAPKQGR